MSAVNQVTSDGSPDFLVQDVPPLSPRRGSRSRSRASTTASAAPDYSLVKTKDQEFDYPGADGDVYTTLHRQRRHPHLAAPEPARLLGCSFGTIKFFTTSAIKSQSRIIIRNNIQRRASSAAAPFLSSTPTPTWSIADGRLYWIAGRLHHAPTATRTRTPEGGLNYIRNSVKVVVDAYNGTMRFYVFDPQDPLLKTYEAIFPELFTPPATRCRRRCSSTCATRRTSSTIQAEVFATYHVDDADVLYNKGDQWQIPDNVSLSRTGPHGAPTT